MDSEDIFIQWKDSVNKSFGAARFLKNSRDSLLGELTETLYLAGIDYDEAKSLKRKVKEFLVSKEGKKGGGKYKGWLENVEEEYDASLLNYYKIGKPSVFIEKNQIVKAWAKEKFGKLYNDSLEEMCLSVDSLYSYEMQKDIFESEWAVTGENIPDWVKNIV